MISAMYLRKSRAEESEPVADTLNRHREELTAFAQRNAITVAAVYEEVVSGDSLHARPQMLRLLDDLHRFEAVLCMDIDRLGRGTMRDQGIILDALRQSGTLVITPEKSYDLENDMDDSLVSFKALFAREEYKLIRGRLKRGVLKTIRDGGYVANAPFGYCNVRVDKRPTLAVNEAEAAAVRMIFDMYCMGDGCQVIADAVNAAGYKPRRTDKFGRTSIAKILRNPVYTGKTAWNQCTFKRPKNPGEKHVRRLNPREEWILADGHHPAIISEEVYKRANAVLDGRYHPPCNTGTVKNPLAGVLYCAQCGGTMVRQPMTGRKYNRPTIMCITRGCCMSSALDIVEEEFFAGLQEALGVLRTTESAAPSLPDYSGIEQQVKAEIARLKGQLGNLHDLLERGVYDEETFLRRRDELNKRIAAAAQVKTAPVKSVLIRRLSNVLSGYWDGEAGERNLLIKTCVARAGYLKPKGSPLKTPPTIEITAWSDCI